MLYMKNIRVSAATAIVLCLLGLMGCLIGYYSSEQTVWDDRLLKAALVIIGIMLFFYMKRLRIREDKKPKIRYRQTYERYKIPQHQFR
jgi:uncharacterized membrane protein YfcA